MSTVGPNNPKRESVIYTTSGVFILEGDIPQPSNEAIPFQDFLNRQDLNRGMVVESPGPDGLGNIRATQADLPNLEFWLNHPDMHDPSNNFLIPAYWATRKKSANSSENIRLAVLTDGHRQFFATQLLYPNGARPNLLLLGELPNNFGGSLIRATEVYRNYFNKLHP